MGFIILGYGVLVLIGGLMGYFKAYSLASLISGLIFGISLIVSGIAMLKKKVWGQYLALGLSILLTLFFGYRFIITKNFSFFPGGLFTLVSLILAILLGIRTNKEKY